MGNINEQMAEFANNLWENYIKAKYKEANSSTLSYYIATVVSNDGGNTLTIKKPFEDSFSVPCLESMNTATAGLQVLVIRFGSGNNNTNHVVVGKADGNPLNGGGGGGGTDHGLPSGGTSGQILVKNSSTDYDAVWRNATYVHTQGEAASTWSITHNMNCYPSVTIVDSTNTIVVGDTTYTDANSLTVSFNGTFKGKAYLS